MTNKRISRSLIVMVFGTFFGILCSTLMNVGLPQLMTAFHVSEAQVQWVTNGYMLVNALMIPVSAYLIKRFLFRHLYILATAIFLVGTLLGALCNQFILVIIARMIQAIGAGMMMPLVNVLAIRYAKPAKKRCHHGNHRPGLQLLAHYWADRLRYHPGLPFLALPVHHYCAVHRDHVSGLDHHSAPHSP